MSRRMRRTRHRLIEQDDSGVTSVARCQCGDTFLGIGPNRLGDARYAWARHHYDSLAHVAQMTFNRMPVEPQRSEYAEWDAA